MLYIMFLVLIYLINGEFVSFDCSNTHLLSVILFVNGGDNFHSFGSRTHSKHMSNILQVVYSTYAKECFCKTWKYFSNKSCIWEYLLFTYGKTEKIYNVLLLKCTLWTNAWTSPGNLQLQGPRTHPQTYWIRIYLLVTSAGDFYAQ